VGEAVNLTLPGAASLTVTYRPNSSIARTVTLPVASDGAVVWTPEQAGVVALAVDGGTTRNVSVRFAGIPWLGVLVLAAAGTILFGGAGYGLKRLFEGDDHAFPLDT